MTARAGRRRPALLPRQDPADLRQEHAAIDKARRGIAQVVEAMDEAPDEYRRAFALCLALAQLSEAARTNGAKAMLQVASGLDVKAAPVPAFMQAQMARMTLPRDFAAPGQEGAG